jgi:hypothetical protein
MRPTKVFIISSVSVLNIDVLKSNFDVSLARFPGVQAFGSEEKPHQLQMQV